MAQFRTNFQYHVENYKIQRRNYVGLLNMDVRSVKQVDNREFGEDLFH